MAAPSSAAWQGMFAIMRKESAQILRDPSAFGIAFILPLILLFLFGYAVSLDTEGTRIGLVDQDRSGLSQDLAATLHHSRWFSVDQGKSARDYEAELVAGRMRAIVIIPVGFARDVASANPRQPPRIQLITDGSIPNTAAFATAQMDGLIGAWARSDARLRHGMANAASSIAAPIALEPHFLYNPELKSRNFLVPGAIAIVMAMIGSMLTALVMAREWERGTIEALFATPIPVAQLIAAKLLPYFALGMISMLICVMVALAIYDVPFRGSFFALLLIAAAFLSAALGQGLLISAATKNQFVATQFSLLSGFLPSLLLSGFLFEISSMPQPIQWLSWLVPARYLIPPLETVFLTGDVWSLFWPNIAAMLGFGALFFWRAARVTQRKVA